MDINDLLNLLSAEQLEELAKLKKQEEFGSKRKQKRRNNERKPENKNLGVVGPRRKKGFRNTTNKPNMPKKKKYAITSELILGKRPNEFLKEVDLHQKDIKVDAPLYEGLSKRSKSKNKNHYVEATCTSCQDVFEYVSPSLCYKDDDGYVFICDDCIRGKI